MLAIKMITRDKIRFFTEIGFGNPTFINTETEFPDGKEIRNPGLVKMKIIGLYFRLWIKRKVFIISSKEGFKIQTKNKNRFKLLFGIIGKEK